MSWERTKLKEKWKTIKFDIISFEKKPLIISYISIWLLKLLFWGIFLLHTSTCESTALKKFLRNCYYLLSLREEDYITKFLNLCPILLIYVNKICSIQKPFMTDWWEEVGSHAVTSQRGWVQPCMSLMICRKSESILGEWTEDCWVSYNLKWTKCTSTYI